MRVTVVTLTFRRPDDLRESLPMLVDAVAEYPGADLLVVDNDTEPSARRIVDELADSRVRYVHEPKPGIAAARNRGLSETEDRDLIVFIDDDERPQPGWLTNLVSLRQASGAEAVVGPVISEFPGELDPWITAGRFFERLRHPTGTTLPVAATNNLLLDRDFVGRHNLRFDEAFGLSGGSDSVFTRQLVRAGGRILWCDEAAVTDVVPPDRATRSWVVRRAFRMGNTEARAQIHLATTRLDRSRQRTLALLRGAVRVLGGGARYLKGRATSSLADQARGQRTLLRGAGMASAAWGYVYSEYARAAAKPEPQTLRVLTSFRTPSETTNPYIVQLHQALSNQPGIEVSTFSWSRALGQRWDVFHVHWPETAFASSGRIRPIVKKLLFGAFLLRLRLDRTAIVWTRHNTETHERGDSLARWLIDRLTAMTHHFILLNKYTSVPVGAGASLIPHGHYRDWFERFPKAPQVEARLGYVGLIRPYKGVEDLVSAFEELPDPTCSLSIGGRPADVATAARISELAGTDDRIDLTLRFLSEPELVTRICEAQLMVFPYLAMHNSGAVLAALSLDRPVLVPRNEVNDDLRAEVGGEWVLPFDGPLTASVLSDALAKAQMVAGRPDLSSRGWGEAGSAHQAAFRQARQAAAN